MMKQKIFLFFMLSLFLKTAIAQIDGKIIPNVDIKDLKGNSFNTKDIQNDGKPIIICFFATYCKPCLTEMKNIAEEYEDWQEETGVKVYAISIDDSRSSSKVPALVRGQNWNFEILLDENSDFKRAMNVNDIPHTFILDGERKIVWQHTTYAPGVEMEYIEQVKKILASSKR